MSKRKKQRALTQRERLIINFLWKFKVATTAMLYHRFFITMKSRSAYNALQRMRRDGLIEIRTNEYGTDPLWAIEKRGLEIIKQTLPELKEDRKKTKYGEESLIVTGTHLGEFIEKIPDDIELVTAQEMRYQYIENLPAWVPDTDEHTPKGYWRFKNGKAISIMSLEVELRLMPKEHYAAHSEFYGGFAKDMRVLWVVRSKQLAKKILQRMYKYKPEYIVHNFVTIKDICEKGWDAQIFAGRDRDETILKLFCENSEYTPNTSLITGFQKYFLDRRLTYCIHSEVPVAKKINIARQYGDIWL